MALNQSCQMHVYPWRFAYNCHFRQDNNNNNNNNNNKLSVKLYDKYIENRIERLNEKECTLFDDNGGEKFCVDFFSLVNDSQWKINDKTKFNGHYMKMLDDFESNDSSKNIAFVGWPSLFGLSKNVIERLTTTRVCYVNNVNQFMKLQLELESIE